MESFILNDLHLWRSALYALIFLGMLLEGEAVLFTAFYLVRQSQLDLYDTIIIVTIGVFIGDSLWYFAGSAIERFPWLKRAADKVSHAFDGLIRQRPGMAVVVSKFIYGFHRPTLLRLRPVGLKYARFLRFDIPGATLWIAVVGTLGYLFSESSGFLKSYFRYGELALLAALAVFFLINKIISRYLKKKLLPEGKDSIK